MKAIFGFLAPCTGILVIVLAVAPQSAAQLSRLSELASIRDAAGDASERARALAARAGPDFQARVLASIHRSCAARGVTRLDEIRPVTVSTEAAATTGKALLEFDFRSSATSPRAAPDGSASPAAGAGASSPPTAAGAASGGEPGGAIASIAAVDNDTDVAFGARGLELRRGQVRTSGSFAIARDAIGLIEIDIATNAPGQMLIGWSESADAPRLRRNNARIELVGDGRVHTYSVDAASVLARGLVAGASVRRFFLASRSTAALEVRGFRVLSRTNRYPASFGTAHEAREGELRSVLYARPPTSLTFDVTVARESPVLETGLGIVATDGIVEFEISVRDGDTSTVMLKRLVRSAPWEDVSIDVARWAGKTVQVSLSARGSRDAVALWSSPLVRPRLGDDQTEPFVVLLEDALRADRLSVYGGPVAAPAHERIASGAVVFDRAFAQASQTRSSVPSLMTSLLPSANGTWDFSDLLSDRYVTLAEALRACGFATASFLQNGNAGPYAGLAQGFDVVFDEERGGPRAADLVAPGSPFERWVARQRGRPWFAYVHMLDPHGPYDPAVRPDLSGAGAGEPLLRDRSIDAPWLDPPTAAARRMLYDAEVAANDVAVGGLLDRLGASGDLDRAVLAVIADHGEFLGEHGGMWRHHPPAHVEVARVPFLLKARGAKVRRVAEPVALLDLMPTLLELAGVDPSALVMQGRSLAGVLAGAAAAQRVIVADEMILDGGERQPHGCGSFATPAALWLLSCTRDEDFVPGRLLAVRGGQPAPLRLIDLANGNFGVETAESLARPILEEVSRRALAGLQREGLKAWRRMTGAGGAAKIVIEPGTAERLRALGYAE